jgi:hypothetical protein
VVKQETALGRLLMQRLIGIVKDLGGQTDTEGTHNSNDSMSTSSDANFEGITPPRLGAGEIGGHKDGSSKSSPHSTAPLEKDMGRLVVSEGGTSRYVSQNFWARLSEQVFKLLFSFLRELF